MRRSGYLLACALVLSAGPALAQSSMAPAPPASGPSQPGIDVNSTLYPRSPAADITRPVPNYPLLQNPLAPAQPVGVPAGNGVFYPGGTVGAYYDDNVFALNSSRLGDWAYFVRPELAWRSSNWSNAQAAASAFVEKRWYSKFTTEDQLNGGVGFSGTAQPDANTQFVGRFQYLHAHEDRGSSDSVTTQFTNPLSYDQLEAAGALNKRFDRVWTSLGVAGAWIHYSDATLAGTTISQSYRNGTIVRVPARLGYVVAPSTSVFVEVSGNQRHFDVSTFDSHGYRAVGGMLFEPGPGARVKGEIFAGYMRQDYSGASFLPVSTWTYGANLAFLVAKNVTAVFDGRRDAKEASLSGGVVPNDGVSVVETVAAGRVDVAVAPKAVIGAGVAYISDQYLNANRTDNSWSPLVSAKYFWDKHLTLGFDYRYLKFDSSGLGVLGYYRNVYLFSANWRY